jgi:hypothetical protein
VYRRQQNEKINFGNIAFNVDHWGSYSNDGRGKYKYWYCSAAAHHVSLTTGDDSAA